MVARNPHDRLEGRGIALASKQATAGTVLRFPQLNWPLRLNGIGECRFLEHRQTEYSDASKASEP
jgi:hypothetical protein